MPQPISYRLITNTNNYWTKHHFKNDQTIPLSTDLGEWDAKDTDGITAVTRAMANE